MCRTTTVHGSLPGCGFLLHRLRQALSPPDADAGMNILIVSYVYAPDRSPRAYRWSALAEYWSRQGHRVDVISGWKQGDERSERRSGVTINRVGGGVIDRPPAVSEQSRHRPP